METVHTEKAAVALNGTNDVTLVVAPPAGVSYIIKRIYGKNTAGANRVLTLDFKEDSTSTPIYETASTADGAYFFQVAGAAPLEFDILLNNTDESLVVVSDGTGTDVIYATYETRETTVK